MSSADAVEINLVSYGHRRQRDPISVPQLPQRICWGRNQSVPPTRCLEEEPGPPLGLIDPNFDQTRRGDVAMFLTYVVGLAETRGQGFVVLC